MCLAVSMHAPAGPVTLDQLLGLSLTWCIPTFWLCQYHASASSLSLIVPSHMVAAHAVKGAESHSCCTSALCKASRKVVDLPMCYPGKQLEIELRNARMCDSERPMALQPYKTDGLMPAKATL